jgi:hypothetical protein
LVNIDVVFAGRKLHIPFRNLSYIPYSRSKVSVAQVPTFLFTYGRKPARLVNLSAATAFRFVLKPFVEIRISNYGLGNILFFINSLAVDEQSENVIL